MTTGSRVPMPAGDSFRGDEQSLTAIWQTLVKRWLIIVSSTLAIFCLVAVHTMRTKPVYESVVRLQIDPSRSSNLGLDDIVSEKLGSEDGDSRIQTEVRLIQSDTVSMRVIDALFFCKSLKLHLYICI